LNILQFNRYSILERPGGTYRYMDDLNRTLAAQGHQVCFVCTTRNNLGRLTWVERAPGYRICQLRVSQSRLSRQWDYFVQVPALMYELDNEIRFDAVAIHDPYIPFGFTTSKMRKRPPLTQFFYISASHEAAYNARRLRSLLSAEKRVLDGCEKILSIPLQRALEHRNLTQADRIIVLSEYTRRMLASFHGVSMLNKTALIPPGVDLQRFSPCNDFRKVRSRLGLPTEATVLLTVRNLSPRMGLENLVQAMRLVKDALPDQDVQLCIGGKGALREVLERMARDLRLSESVHLLGYVSEEELPLYYQACDFFVLPTAALEGFGMVTLEALATNIPVIGTPIGATPEILNRFGGFVADSTSADGIARKLVEVLQRKDRILASWDSRSLIEGEYSWQRIGRLIENLLTNSRGDFRDHASVSYG